MSEVLQQIVARNKAGEATAIPSVCSAHPEVLMASLQLAARLERPVVIEATSNQVNQFGGYTGMTAADFVGFVRGLIDRAGADPAQVVLGGDHLGPQVWKSEPAAVAMDKARTLVASYVQAGIHKIHLDCSEACADDPHHPDDATAAARAADLARTCKDASDAPDRLCFVIGTEVPPPGGARLGEDGEIIATTPEAAQATLAAHQEAFAAAGVADLWPQVAGLVVQPGVEFGPDALYPLPPGRDPGLRAAVAAHPAICLEAHSTDYQSADTYPRLAELGFAFQKVGPALTFAWRRALYGLDHLVSVLRPDAAGLPAVLEAAMQDAPAYWSAHYAADDTALWHFSYADRLRYVWPDQRVQAAVDRLLAAVDALDLHDHVLAEVFSQDTLARAEGLAPSRTLSLARAEVQGALVPYFFGGRA